MTTELLNNPLQLAGWLLCGAVIVWGVLGTAGYFQRQRLLNRQFGKENSILEEQLKLVRSRREQAKNRSGAWEGFANFVVDRKVFHGSSNICSFYLKPKDERLELVPFFPGQHLVFQLPVAGLAQPITRRYSLSDRPGQDHYRVSVKLQLPPEDMQDAPPGLGSTYFHRELEEASESGYENLIQVSSPAGAFCLDPLDPEPVVLIGGGVGITPMLSMFNSIVQDNISREVWLFYIIRNQEENIFENEEMLHPQIKDILRTRGNVHLHIYYSQIESPELLPNGGNLSEVPQHCGRMTVADLTELLPSNNYRFFICGPEAMMDQMERDLEEWGVDEENILSERFQPPTKRKAGDEVALESTIKFIKSNKEIKFLGEDNSILDAAKRAGVPISYDCKAGSCGQCKIAVVSGKVSYNIRTNYKCPPGSCLTCSCLPEGDVILDC